MKVNPSIFRAYDIRGKYPEELSEEVVRHIAYAYLKLYPYAKTLVLAHDTRPSSPLLAKAIRDVFVASGKNVIDLGLAPDPLFYFTLLHYKYDGGIVVSGSHNLGSFNGLSMSVKRKGEDFSYDVIGSELNSIFELLDKEEIPMPSPTPGKVETRDVTNEYMEYVSSRIHVTRKLSLIIDSGNGAMGFLPEKIFKNLGCNVKTLYGEYDGTFPNHAPDPYQEENLKDIQEAVKKEGADMGLAYDADGDRVALIDNKGRVVSGDFAMLMLATRALKKKKGPVVHDVRVSKAFLDEMKTLGVPTHFSVSHHNAVIKKIQEVGAVFGGEITLHFIFPHEYYPVDDALFASLKLAEIVSSHQDFAVHVDTLSRYHTSPELFIDVPDDEKFGLVDKLIEYFKKEKYSVIDVDGARIQLERGWALVRAANTTAHIKCRFEGDRKEDLEKIEREFLSLFKNLGVPITQEHYTELGL